MKVLCILDTGVERFSVLQVECKRAEPKDAMSSQLTGAAAAAGGAMILAQAADGSVGLVPASALQASASLLQPTAGVGPAAAAGGIGLLSSGDLSAAAALRSHELLQQSMLPAGQLLFTASTRFIECCKCIHRMYSRIHQPRLKIWHKRVNRISAEVINQRFHRA